MLSLKQLMHIEILCPDCGTKPTYGNSIVDVAMTGQYRGWCQKCRKQVVLNVEPAHSAQPRKDGE